MANVFLSYSYDEREHIDHIAQQLRAKGHYVWSDESSLKPGDVLWDTIRDAIDRATHYIVLVSPRSLASPNVQREIDHAYARSEQGKLRFIPAILFETPTIDDERITKHYYVRYDYNVDNMIAELLKGLE